MKRLLIIVLALVVLAGAWFAYYRYQNPRINDPSFQRYKQEDIYCAQFNGPRHQSTREIYNNWKNHELIGC